MSHVALVWLTVTLVSAAALLALLIGLVRHVLVLYRSLAEFQRQVTPIAEEIVAGSGRAAERTAGLSERAPFGRS